MKVSEMFEHVPWGRASTSGGLRNQKLHMEKLEDCAVFTKPIKLL